MAPRASWKGFLKIAESSVPVALYAAASTSERIALNTINQATGHRVQRQFVDAGDRQAGRAGRSGQGLRVAKDQYVVLEPDEIEAAIPQGDKTLTVSAFVDLDRGRRRLFRQALFSRPLGPERRRSLRADARGDARGEDGRGRPGGAVPARPQLAHPPHDNGLVASTLNFDYEVRPAAQAFSDVPPRRSRARCSISPCTSSRPSTARSIRARSGPLRGCAGGTGEAQDRGQGDPETRAAEERADRQPPAGAARQRRGREAPVQPARRRPRKRPAGARRRRRSPPRPRRKAG